MQINFFLTMAIAGIIPMIVGSIWYNPKVLGNAWMQAVGTPEEKLREGFNPLLVFGLAYVLSVFIAFVLSGFVIHQMGFFGMLQHHLNEVETQKFFSDTLQTYGNEFRNFSHGAIHGAIAGIGLALPMVTTNALFERKGFKYIAINSGYWIICLILMGGFICQFADLKSLA